MSGANMKLCLVRIDLADDAPEPVAKPEEGEFIEKHLVPLKGLVKTLSGENGSAVLHTSTHALWSFSLPPDFQAQGYAVDARLAHLAVGLELAGRLGGPSRM